VKLIRVQIHKNPAILALSSRSWLNYTYQNLMHFTPLIYDNLDYAWSFSAELSPEGLIGIAGSVLRCVGIPYYVFERPFLTLLFLGKRIFNVPRLGVKLKQDSMPLSYTPRKFITHPTNHYLYMIEGDHRVMGPDAMDKRLQELVTVFFILVWLKQLNLSSSTSREKSLMKKWLISHQMCLVDQRLPLELGVHAFVSSTR